MKWIVSSTAIPITIAPTNIVVESIGRPSQPITASTATMGSRFGTMLTRPRRRLPSNNIINGVMTPIAKA